MRFAAKLRTRHSGRSCGSQPQDGGDDQLAAVAVLHQLGGSVRIIARHFWHAAEGEAEGIVTGAMWEQIRAYDWRARTRRHAAAIHHATRKSVRSVLLRDDSRWQSRGVIPLNPQSWFFETVMERPEAAVGGVDRSRRGGSTRDPPELVAAPRRT